MIDRILKFFYASLFFLTPLIFFSTTSELFEFNKMIFIYIITILVGFFWLLKMILAKKIVFRKTPFDIFIILFLIFQIVSTLFSLDRHTSFFGYYGRFNGGLMSLISYIILYYGLVANPINVEGLLKTSLWSSFAVMIYGLPGKLGHDLTCFLVTAGRNFDNSCWSREANVFDPSDRVFSTLGQPNWLGAYLAINFFIGIYYLLKNSSFAKASEDKQKYILKIKNIFFPTVYLFLNFSFILFSRSRSALGAVGIGLILFIIYYLLFIKTEVKKLIITLLIITVIPILLFKTGVDRLDQYLSISNIKNSAFVKTSSSGKPTEDKSAEMKQFNNVSSVTESLDIRKIVWKGAIDLGLKYPLFGTGVETFAYSYNFVRPQKHNLTSEWDFIYNKAHNEYLNYLATTGFVGLLTYLGLIITFIVYLVSKIKYQRSNIKETVQNSKIKKSFKTLSLYFNFDILTLSLLISYLTILITNFFGFSTTTINLFFYLIPGFIVILVSERSERIQNLKEDSGPNSAKASMGEQARMTLGQYSFIFLLLSLTIYLLFSTFAYWFADTQYALGINYLRPRISDYQKAAAYLERALKIRKEPLYEDKFSSSLSYLAAIAAYQKQADLAKKLINLSDYYNQKTLKQSPQNVFYWKTRAKNQYLFYQVTLNSSNLNEGIQALLTGQKLAPTDPKIPYSLAVYYSIFYDQAKEPLIKEKSKEASLSEINKALELKKDFVDGSTLKKELQKKYGLL